MTSRSWDQDVYRIRLASGCVHILEVSHIDVLNSLVFQQYLILILTLAFNMYTCNMDGYYVNFFSIILSLYCSSHYLNLGPLAYDMYSNSLHSVSISLYFDFTCFTASYNYRTCIVLHVLITSHASF